MIVDASRVLIEGPWRHEFVPANGSRFHVAVAGPDEHELPLVLLLHGLPQFWWAWRHQLPALAERGYRVAAMDLRGTGASDKPPHGYDAVTYARDVAGVVRSLGAARAVVVGQGLGGNVAWSMPALQPAVTRAVAALGAPHPLHARAALRALVSGALARHLGYFQLPYYPERSLTRRDLVAGLLREWGGDPQWPDPETEETYREAMRIPFAAHSAMEHVRWLVRSTPRFDGRRYLGALRAATPLPVPSLQLHGELDACLPVGAAATDAAVAGPAHRFTVVPGAGHFLPEQAPQEVTEALGEWLAEVSPA